MKASADDFRRLPGRCPAAGQESVQEQVSYIFMLVYDGIIMQSSGGQLMAKPFTVSTPSRLCLFGEHQDYLGLEVVAAAIDLRFIATASSRDDSLIKIAIDRKSVV